MTTTTIHNHLRTFSIISSTAVFNKGSNATGNPYRLPPGAAPFLLLFVMSFLCPVSNNRPQVRGRFLYHRPQHLSSFGSHPDPQPLTQLPSPTPSQRRSLTFEPLSPWSFRVPSFFIFFCFVSSLYHLIFCSVFPFFLSRLFPHHGGVQFCPLLNLSLLRIHHSHSPDLQFTPQAGALFLQVDNYDNHPNPNQSLSTYYSFSTAAVVTTSLDIPARVTQAPSTIRAAPPHSLFVMLSGFFVQMFSSRCPSIV